MESNQRTCPKCGSCDLYVRFMPIDKKVHNKEAFACKSFCKDFALSTFDDLTRGIIEEECLYHHCKTCQYDWATKILDSKGAA